MATFGLIELIAILATVGGFGINANPNAPGPAEVMAYAPADADFMVHVDLEAVIPGNYKALKALPEHVSVRGNAQAQQALEEVIREVDAALSAAKFSTGIDLVSDLGSLSMWARLPSAGTPEFLVVVRGKLPADLLDRMAQMGGSAPGKLDQINGIRTLSSPDGTAAIALKDGALLLGTPAWIRARLAKGWQAPRVKSGTLAAHAYELLEKKPFLTLISRPSKVAVRRMVQELENADNVAADLVSGHELASLVLRHDGMSWTWQATSSAGYERAVMASEGALELFRSGHLATRGVVKMLMASLPSYAGKVAEVDAVLRNRGELIKLVDELTGDGSFQVDMQTQAKMRRVTVHATGKKLSDVLPAIGILPILGGIGYFAVASPVEALGAPETEVGPMIEESAPGLDAGAIWRDVWREAGRAPGM